MVKKVSDSQMIGAQGEVAVQLQFQKAGFIYRTLGTLDTGVDGIAEPVVNNLPMGLKLNVQVKTKQNGRYDREGDSSFTYLLNTDDLNYWRQHPEPVVIVLHRLSDNSFYWKSVDAGHGQGNRTLQFSKLNDCLDASAREALIKACTDKRGLGAFVPAAERTETAILNMFPITLPEEIYVSTSPYSSMRKAGYKLGQAGRYRSDWIIANSTGAYWSFHDPRENETAVIVDHDQVEAVDTASLSESDDPQTLNDFAFLLRRCFDEQFADMLDQDREKRVTYFRASDPKIKRMFTYQSFVNQTTAEVVMVQPANEKTKKRGFVRHHAIETRFEYVGDEWSMMISPTYYFTENGYKRMRYPETLLSGKKRLDNNATVRGQIMMWQRLFCGDGSDSVGMFDDRPDHYLTFGAAPIIELPLQVPEQVWGERIIQHEPGIGSIEDTLFDVD